MSHGLSPSVFLVRYDLMICGMICTLHRTAPIVASALSAAGHGYVLPPIAAGVAGCGASVL